jgi:hypothetical protein
MAMTFQNRELQYQQDPEAPDSLLSEPHGLGTYLKSPNGLKLPSLHLMRAEGSLCNLLLVFMYS